MFQAVETRICYRTKNFRNAPHDSSCVVCLEEKCWEPRDTRRGNSRQKFAKVTESYSVLSCGSVNFFPHEELREWTSRQLRRVEYLEEKCLKPRHTREKFAIASAGAANYFIAQRISKMGLSRRIQSGA